MGFCNTVDSHQPMKFQTIRNSKHPQKITSAYALSRRRDLNSVLVGSTCILRLTAKSKPASQEAFQARPCRLEEVSSSTEARNNHSFWY